MKSQSSTSVSLFSNCGAGDLGFKNAGFRFDIMAELIPKRLKVCLLNHKGAIGIAGDLRDTWPQVVSEYRRKRGAETLSLLAACPPCQGMSSARSDRGADSDADAGMFDDRNLLVTVISSIANELLPLSIVVENVPAFLTKNVRHPISSKPTTAANFLIDELAVKYYCFPILTNLCDYGVPQNRKRTFLTFIRRDLSALSFLTTGGYSPYPKPYYHSECGGAAITIGEALRSFDLPSLDSSSEKRADSKHSSALHRVPVWSDKIYAMVSSIRKNSGRSAWQNDICKNCKHISTLETAACCESCSEPLHRPVMKSKNGKLRLVRGFRSSTYARINPKKPSPAITTASGYVSSNNTIHPFENRVLSVLECALLQTIPLDFNWGDTVDSWGISHVRAMVGEAVPPLFTYRHGKVLFSLLNKGAYSRCYNANGHRCTQATNLIETSIR